uniref:Uncharacterized protein n=1 Tax=Neogobius melanostomus TaxID=47308 RepID=A0A8C6TN83_9GOBI
MACKPINVLITGANRGLGLEMVKQIMKTQRPLSMVFACCRDPDGEKAQGLRELAVDNIIKIIRMDVADPKSIKEAASQVGSLLGQSGLNLIINNAAVALPSTFSATTPEQMHDCYRTNAVGPTCIIQEFLPYLRTAAKDSEMPGMSIRKAAVVNISTFVSSIGLAKDTYKKFPCLPYRASKAALNMMVVCASVDLQQDEILCMLLHPGWVRTDMGGPNGEIDPQESVQSMLEVMSSMTEKHHGKLLDYKGKSMPW